LDDAAPALKKMVKSQGGHLDLQATLVCESSAYVGTFVSIEAICSLPGFFCPKRKAMPLCAV